MSTGAVLPILLRTKFHRPRAVADLIPRPSLKERLDGVWDRPLALVSAPAGFGKSTLLSAWLDASNRPSAWISLDENDSDPGLFLAYFLGALRGIFPNGLAATETLLSGVNLPPLSVITRTLLNELDDLDRDFVLVLDDYHAITDQSVHDLISALLQHPPNHMHVVIATRRDPPLPLRLLRARAQITEIRAEDLRFSTREIATFVKQALGAPLSDEAIAVVAEKTEGWAAGLRLTTLTLRYSDAIDGPIARLHTQNKFVMDYLINEVQTHIPPAIQSFLLRTAILDRFCVPLCLEVIGPDCGDCQPQICLEWLEQNGMFTTALDTQGQWYRYHHLFQEFLRARIARLFSAGEIAALHLRASAWFAQNGYLEEALRHALAGQDEEVAVLLVAQHRHALLNSEQRPRLDRWLKMFPSLTVARHAELVLTSVWIAELDRADARAIQDLLTQAQALVDQMTGDRERARQLQGEIDTLHSIEKGFAGDDPQGAISLAAHALEVLPQSWYLTRTEAWLQLAIGYQTSGRLNRSYEVLADARREDVADAAAPRARLWASTCFIDWMAADLDHLLESARRTVNAGQASDRQLESLGWGHHFLAIGYYHRNDLAAAELHADTVQNQRHACHRLSVVHSAFVLAAVHRALGRPDEARLALNRVNDYLEETRNEALQRLVQAFAAELAAMRGDLDTAGRWAATVGPQIPLRAMGFFYAPQLTLPKALLVMNTPASRRQAGEALAQLHEFVTTTHNTRFTIEVLALQALLQQAEGDALASLTLLEQAVLMAEPGGFIRLFADLGPRMAGLLALLRSSGVAPGYIGRILQAFRDDALAASDQGVALRPGGHTELVEPLTDRELQVLALLAQRLSYKEIAQRLVIAPSTVKRHTTNIYQKLQAHGRREAMAVATRLGLI